MSNAEVWLRQQMFYTSEQPSELGREERLGQARTGWDRHTSGKSAGSRLLSVTAGHGD
jgi:hypothetical protein